MKLNQKLSWKFLIPIGLLVWLFGGGFRIIGSVMIIFGIVDLITKQWTLFKNKASLKNKNG